MANESTTTTATELVLAKAIEAKVLLELRAFRFMRALVRVADISAKPTMAVSFPKWNTMASAALSEGTAASNTAIDTTETTLTASKIVLQVEITEELKRSSIVDMGPEALQLLARSLEAKFNVDAAAVLSGFATAVGTSGSKITRADMISAVANYNIQNAGIGAMPVFVLYPQQIADLQNDVSSDASGLSPAAANIASLLGIGGNVVTPNPGSFLSIPVMQTTDVPTANAGVDSGGAIIAVPVGGSGQAAIGMALKWDPLIEPFRVTDKVSDRLTGSFCYAVGKIDTNRGISVITKR